MTNLCDLIAELRAEQRALNDAYGAWFEPDPERGDMTADYEAKHIKPLQDAVDKARMRLLRKPSKLPIDVLRKIVSIYGDEVHCQDSELETLVRDARRFL